MPCNDPALASANGRMRALRRYRPNEEFPELQAEIVELRIAAKIRQLVADAPELSNTSRERLARLLRAGSNAERTDAA